jgi:hypothetical protein
LSWYRKTVHAEVDLLTGLHSGAFDAYSRGLEAAALGVMMLPAARWNGFHPYRSRRGQQYVVHRESTRYAHAIDE